MKKSYGTLKTGKTKEEIFQTCLTKELYTNKIASFPCDAQEFYEAVQRARQNYRTELQTLNQKQAMLNARSVRGKA